MTIAKAIATNRESLRHQTREDHNRAESTWTKSGRFDSRQDYNAWLTALYHVHSALGVAAAQTLGASWLIDKEQSRCRALERDLGTCGSEKTPEKTGTRSWAWGVQYALNGSALGASLLLKSGAIDDSWPRNYLTEMQAFAKSGALKQFFSSLDRTPVDIEEAGHGARSVFGALADNKPYEETAGHGGRVCQQELRTPL